MDYKKLLEEKYQERLQEQCSSPPNSKLEWVGDEIFDFTTYDGQVSELFTTCMFEALKSILNGTTFEYIENRDNYLNYLAMVNMPFLRNKLEWGTSIRGAWIDEHGHPSNKDEIFEIGGINVPRKELKSFLTNLIEWTTLKH